MNNSNLNGNEQKNGIIAALFLFQYSMLIPLMQFISLSFLVAISGIVLMLVVFWVNKRIVINKKMALLVFTLIIVFLLKILIDGSEPSIIVNFLMIAIPPVIVYSYQFDCGKFLEWSSKLSIVNFLLLFLEPFVGEDIAYMRFGYAMVLTAILAYILVTHPNYANYAERSGRRKKSVGIVWWVILVVSIVETIIFGSRGALVVFVAFVLIDLLLIHKKNVLKNSILTMVGFIGLFNIENILSLLVSIANRFNVASYSLQKFQYQLSYGIEAASSGRGRLYAEALESIKENPLFGSPMISYEDGELYTHNLFLQVGKDLGLIAMILMILFVLYCLYLISAKRLENKEKTVLAILFAVSVVRLLLSSILWERPEFWMLITFVMNYRKSTAGKSLPNEYIKQLKTE